MAAVVAGTGAGARLETDAERRERLNQMDSMPDYIEALTVAFVNAREQGRYDIMRALAGHGLTLIRRASFGEGSKANLLFRRHRAEALFYCGLAAGALAEVKALLPVREKVSGPENPETLSTRILLAQCCLEAGDRDGAASAIDGVREGLVAKQLRPEHRYFARLARVEDALAGDGEVDAEETQGF